MSLGRPLEPLEQAIVDLVSARGVAPANPEAVFNHLGRKMPDCRTVDMKIAALRLVEHGHLQMNERWQLLPASPG